MPRPPLYLWWSPLRDMLSAPLTRIQTPEAKRLGVLVLATGTILASGAS